MNPLIPKGIAWYDQPTIMGIKPYIKQDGKMIPNPDYVEAQQMKKELVNHPLHYNAHPSGVEAILICEKMNFNVGNAFKYLYRCTDKNNTLEDLRKAQWYIRREIERRVKIQFRWMAEGDTNYRSDDITQILSFEYRFSGWMCQTLENLFVASVRPRGIEALDRALTAVGTMIQMQELREGKV
jgi:hypothetical protein